MVWGAKVVGDQKGGDQKCACLKFIIIVSHICSCRSHVSNSDAIKLRVTRYSTLDIIQNLSLDIIQYFGYYYVTPIGYYSLLWILFRHAFGYCSVTHIGYYSVPWILISPLDIIQCTLLYFGYYSVTLFGHYSGIPFGSVGYYSVLWILFCHPDWILIMAPVEPR